MQANMHTHAYIHITYQYFCDKARDGGWCHIFPEGRLWQPWKLKKDGKLLGDLKPGVGKLIANCETVYMLVCMYVYMYIYAWLYIWT